jgi:hypothetical protein
MVHMANGVAEIWPHQPFTVRVVNTSTKIHRLPKGMVLGHALPHPTSMMALIADTDVVGVPETETPPSSQDSTVGNQEQVKGNLSPMEYGLERDPPPLPDRPNVEGDAWQEAEQNIDRCGVADSGKCNQPITELI